MTSRTGGRRRRTGTATLRFPTTVAIDTAISPVAATRSKNQRSQSLSSVRVADAASVAPPLGLLVAAAGVVFGFGAGLTTGRVCFGLWTTRFFATLACLTARCVRTCETCVGVAAGGV
jgi:hypothetical protein